MRPDRMGATKMAGKKVVLFTDLDGTLLDFHTYSYKEATEGINLMKSKGVPLVFCSAKTRAEQELYQDKLGLRDPFIVENGGAVFLRKDYFSLPYPFHRSLDRYNVIELGLPYERILKILAEVREETQIKFKGYRDMNEEEVAAITGLSSKEAKMAKMREYVETVKFESSEADLRDFCRKLRMRGLQVTFGGRFLSVMGSNNKGRAAVILKELYRREFGPTFSIGIGDSRNDLPLLSSVDLPILVQKPGGRWEDIDLPHVIKADGIGPAGWNRIIIEILTANRSP